MDHHSERSTIQPGGRKWIQQKEGVKTELGWGSTPKFRTDTRKGRNKNGKETREKAREWKGKSVQPHPSIHPPKNPTVGKKRKRGMGRGNLGKGKMGRGTTKNYWNVPW